MPVIPQSVITSGKWYQPYIHSVPENYYKAQKAYYSNFTIKAAINNANGIVKKLFPMLLAFYTKREKEFAEKFLKIPHEELATKIEPFLNNLENLMETGKGQDDYYGIWTELVEAIARAKKQVQEAEDLAVKNVTRQGKESLKQAQRRAKSQSRRESKAQQKQEFKQIISSRVETIIDHHKLKDPNKVVNSIVNNLLSGKPIPASYAKDAEKIIEAFKKENRAADRALSGLGTALSTRKKDGTIRKQTPAEAMGTTMGLFNEDIVVDQLLRAAEQGAEVLLGDFVTNFKWKSKRNKITVKQTGEINTTRQMQDGEIVITNEYGQDFVMGIDMKYSSSSARTYSRGANIKSMNEIIDLFPSQTLAKEMMYLLANSYYHNDTNTYNDIIGTSGSGGEKELFKLINMVRALYGLLPASAVNFTNLNDIGAFVKDDKRFFIVVNENVILMTAFLGQVQNLVEEGKQGVGANIRGLRTGNANDSNKGIETILQSWDASHNIRDGANKKGQLYNEKLRIIGLYRKAQQFKRSGRKIFQLLPGGYNYLKSYTNNNVTRSDLMTSWKFSVTNQFKITPRG